MSGPRDRLSHRIVTNRDQSPPTSPINCFVTGTHPTHFRQSSILVAQSLEEAKLPILRPLYSRAPKLYNPNDLEISYDES